MNARNRLVQFPIHFSPGIDWEEEQLERLASALAEAALDAVHEATTRPVGQHPHKLVQAVRKVAADTCYSHGFSLASSRAGGTDAVAGYALTVAGQFLMEAQKRGSGETAFILSSAQRDLTRAMAKLPPNARKVLQRAEQRKEKWWEKSCRGAMAVAQIIEAGQGSEVTFALPSATDDLRHKIDLFMSIEGGAKVAFQVKSVSAEEANFAILECKPSSKKGRDPVDLHRREAAFNGVQRLNADHGTHFISVIFRVYVPCTPDEMASKISTSEMLHTIIENLSPSKRGKGKKSTEKNPDPPTKVEDES